MDQSNSQLLIDLYRRMLSAYGPQHWWPGDSPFEVIIGAILTQSAAWHNVEKAINNLKAENALSPEKIRSLPVADLAALIRPCGYYNAKTIKLKSFVSWLGLHYHDSLEILFGRSIAELREQLLSIHGIGEETADSIILYAAAKPIFVIDTYTKRIGSRIGLLPAGAGYDTWQKLFMNNLPPDTQLFNEYHALLVNLAKHNCLKTPVCSGCCLACICQFHKTTSDA